MWGKACEHQEFFPQGQLETPCISASLGGKGHGGRMFNIKTSDKVPSGYIFCIKEGALGNRRFTLTRKLSSAAPNCYRRPGKASQQGQEEGEPRCLADRWL